MRFALVAVLAVAFCACSNGGTSNFSSSSGSSTGEANGTSGGSGSASTGSGSSSSSSGQGSTGGSSSTGSQTSSRAASTGSTGGSSSAGSSTSGGSTSSGSTGGSSSGGSSSGGSTGSASSTGGSTGGSSGGLTCPAGYTAGTANGHPVCKSSTGIPLFSHVFVIMMENTSASSLSATATPYLETTLAPAWATSSAYSGVTDPSLPNYIAITSGGTQSIGCDCQPSGSSACNLSFCSNLLGTEDCNCGGMTVQHLGDLLDATSQTWREYGESMGTACNTTSSGAYATKHIPFLYYNDVLANSNSCDTHVVDYSDFATDLAATPYIFSFISPNLNDDMHGTGTLQTSQDVTNGDTWLSNNVPAILASPAFTDDGILFIVWDEGGLSLSYNDIPFFVLSPLAKHGGYVSSVAYNHYSLLATIEDGLNLTPRLGNAAGIAPLADFFPAN